MQKNELKSKLNVVLISQYFFHQHLILQQLEHFKIYIPSYYLIVFDSR